MSPIRNYQFEYIACRTDTSPTANCLWNICVEFTILRVLWQPKSVLPIDGTTIVPLCFIELKCQIGCWPAMRMRAARFGLSHQIDLSTVEHIPCNAYETYEKAKNEREKKNNTGSQCKFMKWFVFMELNMSAWICHCSRLWLFALAGRNIDFDK